MSLRRSFACASRRRELHCPNSCARPSPRSSIVRRRDSRPLTISARACLANTVAAETTSAVGARPFWARSLVPSIVVDAGPLIALFDRDDRHHEQAVTFIRECLSPLTTNLPVLTEATFLLRFSVEAQR